LSPARATPRINGASQEGAWLLVAVVAVVAAALSSSRNNGSTSRLIIFCPEQRDSEQR
jgi:hypothetical protein